MSNNTATPLVIDCGDAPAIIVAWPTGITYTNQTGGVACNHPEMEGFLIPLPNVLSTIASARWDFCMTVRDEDAYIVERDMAKALELLDIKDFRVDRSAENEEAWIHCTFTLVDYWSAETTRRLYLRGVLTYENCD